ARTFLAAFGLPNSPVLILVRIVLKLLEEVFLVWFQVVVSAGNNDVGIIARQGFGHVFPAQLLDSFEILIFLLVSFQDSLHVFILQAFVGEQTANVGRLFIGKLFSAVGIPPKAGGEQQQDAGPEKEAAFPL